MKKYLDDTGLTYFWSKVKALFATKSEVSAKANSADLATVATTGEYTDLNNAPQYVLCTFSEYNAIASHDANTYYIIISESNA